MADCSGGQQFEPKISCLVISMPPDHRWHSHGQENHFSITKPTPSDARQYERADKGKKSQSYRGRSMRLWNIGGCVLRQGEADVLGGMQLIDSW